MLTGCSEKKAQSDNNENKQVEVPIEDEEENTVEETRPLKFKDAPTSAEDIIAAGAGIKMKDMSTSSQWKLNSEDLAIMEEFPVEELSKDEITNGIIEWFAMDYTDVHKPFVDFEADYGEYGIDKREMKQLNISVLIDASGSMKATIGGEQMMALGKDAVKRFGTELPEEAIVSLRVYGHAERVQRQIKRCPVLVTS